jgi:uncharacterized lipoprotein YajG
MRPVSVLIAVVLLAGCSSDKNVSPEPTSTSPITSKAFRVDPGQTVAVDLTIHAI